MNLVPSRTQLRRTRHTATLLTGALLSGTGVAHAQVFATTIVPPSSQVVATYTGDTTAPGTPTFNESFIGGGTAVPYAAQVFTAPAAAVYNVQTTVTSGYSSSNDFVQFLYSPTFTPSSPKTNYAGFIQPTNGAVNFSETLNANQQFTFVDGGIVNTDVGTVQTVVTQINPGSTSTIPDATPGGVSQTLNVTSTNAINAFNSITIDGLNHGFIGDLTATLTHNGVTVDLFDHTGANNDPSSPGYNYGLGSAAQFSGGNYTFALSGASLAAVQDFTAASSAVTYQATGNAANGFAPANAGNTLNSFLNQSVFGAWTLNITDSQPDDTGSFTGFSFGINNPAAVPETSTGLGFGLLLSLIMLGRAGQVLQARRRSTRPAA